MKFLYTILYYFTSYFKLEMDSVGKQFSVVDFRGKLNVVNIDVTTISMSVSTKNSVF